MSMYLYTIGGVLVGYFFGLWTMYAWSNDVISTLEREIERLIAQVEELSESIFRN